MAHWSHVLLVALALTLVAHEAAASIAAEENVQDDVQALMRRLLASAQSAVPEASAAAPAAEVAGVAPETPVVVLGPFNRTELLLNPGLLRVRSYDSPTAQPLVELAAQGALVSATLSDAPADRAAVPDSFLGLSLDVKDVEGVANPDYIELVKQLTSFQTGPLYMRVGAYSADRLVAPWNGTVYFALARLHRATGVKFIMGVNQHAEDEAVTQMQVKRSQQLLPSGSIVSFAVGNEPDMYSLAAANGLPGSDLPKPADWLGKNWVPVARRIYRAAFDAAGARPMLAGPDWSDAHLSPKTLQWWLRSVRKSLNMITVHYYGGEILKDTKISELLDDARMVSKMSNVRALVNVGKESGGLPLRITESATISYGGVQGLSDTAGAAIWALDVALELAYAGASGIHFHQVLNRAGNANYNAIVYDANTSTVYARPPLYGYLMLQQSLAGGADIVGRSVSPSGCKVWLLKGRGDGSLRAVVINKSGQGRECAADVQLDAAQARRYSDQAAAEYIHAPGGLDERWRVFYSNWYYDVQGSARLREAKTVPLQRYSKRDRRGHVRGAGFVAHLTNGTLAALVNIPLASPAEQQAFDAYEAALVAAEVREPGARTSL